MNFSELLNYVDTHYKPEDKFAPRETDVEVVEKQYDDRVHQTYLDRLKKCGKNLFKVWFYLGFGKDKEKNVSCHSTLFDTWRKKKFYRWYRKVERYGVDVKRPYFSDYTKHVFNYRLFKFYDYKYSKLWKLKYLFEYKPHCSVWDMSDVMDYIIVKLTILGVYHGGGFSHLLYRKQQMHSIWTARKMLIEAISSEEIYMYAKDKSFQEHFGINMSFYDLLGSFDDKEFLNTGGFLDSDEVFTVSPKNLKSYFDEKLYLTYNGRKEILRKCKEMENYWYELDKSDELSEETRRFYLSDFMRIKVREAFEYLSQNYFDFGD